MSMGNGAWRWSHKTSRGDCTGYPRQPVSRNHQADRHTEYQWKLKYLPHTYHATRDGQEKSGCKYVSPFMQAPATPHTDPWGKAAGQHCVMFNLP